MRRAESGRDLLPQLLTSYLRTVTDDEGDHLPGLPTQCNRNPSFIGFFQDKPTIIHQVLKLAAHQVQQVFQLIPAALLFFFEPAADGVSSDAESARQTTQTRTLLIGG